MFYYLFDYLEQQFQLSGAGVFKYISFRAAMAFICSLLIASIFGKHLIAYLYRKQVGETVRDLDLKGQKEKEGTPTMGGIMIILSTLIPVLLFCIYDNIYIILLITTTLWMGIIGFIDDHIKVFKKNKEGLRGKFKILGQLVLGLIVGIVLYTHPAMIAQKKQHTDKSMATEQVEHISKDPIRLETTVPFFKDNTLDYQEIASAIGLKEMSWLLFIPIVIFIVMAVSNGTNLTDGLDGLATGTSAIVVATFGIFAWVSGNIVFADYLNIMYIPESGEIMIFIAALTGALMGFLWYNTYPAQIFMGDTGSLTIGGVIAVIALCIRKELLIPVLAGVFFVENLSVLLQVAYFKWTKKRTGVGKRIFLMAPLHHHYQKKGFNEIKIVVRFWIVGIFLAALTIVTLKLR